MIRAKLDSVRQDHRIEQRHLAHRFAQVLADTAHRRIAGDHLIEQAFIAYHSTWYLPAVRELAARKDFKANPEWIAATLWPTITPTEAAHALAILLELKLLVKEGRRIVQGDAVVSTGPEARSVNIASYHRTMLARAADSIDEIPAPLRDISSITMCLSPDGLATLKERIQRFRRELMELATLEAEPQQVIQVNFQLFPLSRVTGQ